MGLRGRSAVSQVVRRLLESLDIARMLNEAFASEADALHIDLPDPRLRLNSSGCAAPNDEFELGRMNGHRHVAGRTSVQRASYRRDALSRSLD